MAIDNQEEYEQGEQLRVWLRANGLSMLGGIAIGLALIAGWQWWQRKQLLAAENVSDAYAAVAAAVDAGADTRKVAAAEHKIRADDHKSVYPALAAMRLAAEQVDKGDAKGALATLDEVGTVTLDPALSQLLQLRAARVLVILGRPADAIARLDKVKDPAWTAVAEEIRGDAESAQGHVERARDAYARALAKLPDDAPGRTLLQMKLTESGGVVPTTEAKKA